MGYYEAYQHMLNGSPGKREDYTRDREIKKDCRGEIRQKSGQEPSQIKGSKRD